MKRVYSITLVSLFIILTLCISSLSAQYIQVRVVKVNQDPSFASDEASRQTIIKQGNMLMSNSNNLYIRGDRKIPYKYYSAERQSWIADVISVSDIRGFIGNNIMEQGQYAWLLGSITTKDGRVVDNVKVGAYGGACLEFYLYEKNPITGEVKYVNTIPGCSPIGQVVLGLEVVGY